MKSLTKIAQRSLHLALLGSLFTAGLMPIAIAADTSRIAAPATPTPAIVPDSAKPIDENFVLKIRKEGGFCANAGCFQEVAILSDGTYRYTDFTQRVLTGKFHRRTVAVLKHRIAVTQFDRIKSKPFPDNQMCPLAYDGPETIYSFKTAKGIERLPECTYALDAKNPLFKQANQLFDRALTQLFAESSK